jgi:hypothetical protein
VVGEVLLGAVGVDAGAVALGASLATVPSLRLVSVAFDLYVW